MVILQILMAVTLFFFVNTFNIITVWYLAGLYLVFLGWWLLLDDGDIFVGFLWVIDLGVGLIFFIFIVHYSTFLHQKSFLNKTSRELTFSFLSLLIAITFFFWFALPFDTSSTSSLIKTWLFYVSWYDYYDFFFSSTVTDLNLLHEIYFTNNAFEFFIINFFLLYGIIGSILLSFLIKRIFNVLNLDQHTNYSLTRQPFATLFIRNQDYLKQQQTSAGTRVWLKKKNSTL